MTKTKFKRDGGAALVETALALTGVALVTYGLLHVMNRYRDLMRVDLQCFRAARAAIVWGDEPDAAERVNKAAELALAGMAQTSAGKITADIQQDGASEMRIGQPISVSVHWQPAGGAPAISQTCTLISESGVYEASQP